MKSHKNGKSCFVLSCPSILKRTWTRGCWSYSEAYFCACAAVRFSVSGFRWKSRLSPTQACSVGGKERKTKCDKEEKEMTNNRTAVSRRQRPHWLPGLIFAHKLSRETEQKQQALSGFSKNSWMIAPGGWAAEELALHFMTVRKPP